MSLNSTFPVSVKDKYDPNDIVDFLLSFDNTSIQTNSIRLKGVLNITNPDGTPYTITDATDVNYNTSVGIHGAFQGFTSACDKNGVIENWSSEYPRYQCAKTEVSTAKQSLAAQSSNLCELKIGNDRLAKYLITNNRYDQPNSMPFSFKPQIALNKSNINISHNKTGDIKVSCRLATKNQFIYGAQAADVTFNISDLQLDYTTVPQDTKGTLQMEVIQMVKNTAESNNTNISTRVPVLARSLSVVFRQERWLDQPTYDHLENESPPDPQRVEFVMSDTNQYITYALENREEFLYNYQLSLGADPDGKSMLTTANADWELNVAKFGLGIDFGQYINLAQNKVGFNLKSGITSTNKYALFMYFRGIVSI